MVVEMKVVSKGDTVKLNYIGRLAENNKLFDTSKEDVARAEGIFDQNRDYEPLEIKAGVGLLIKGFDDALMGMKVGEEKTVTIPPDLGYGHVKPEFIQELTSVLTSREREAMQVGHKITLPDGRTGRLLEIKGDKVKVDFNHELAGKTLVFKIEIVKIL